MTRTLADLQSMFQARVTQGAEGIDPHLADGGRFMGVYDYAYRARLIEILGEEFEALHTLMGDAQFGDAMRGYIAAHPSTSRSARWLGQHLPAWLAETQPWSALPEVGAMAAFEWALSVAFDAPDAASIGFDVIAAVPPEAWPMLTLTFHPSLQVFTLSHDVAPFYRAVKDEVGPAGAPSAFPAPALWGTWRDADTLIVRYRALEADEAAMLSAAQGGQSFDALCEVLAALGAPDQAAMRAATLLRQWIENGWIIGIDADGLSW